MADEELHETTADDQNDLQSTNDTAAVEEGNCIDEETQWKKIDLLVSCQDFL